MTDSKPTMGVGRADHEERRERRADRLEACAQKERARAAAAHRSADAIASVIPMGQPVLVGHHSERRHRRDLAKIDRGMRTAFNASRYADELDRRAAAVRENGAISSDDPDALDKLRDKLAELVMRREEIKAANKRCRKGDAEAIAAVLRAYPMMRSCGHDPRKGAPSYVVTNMSGEIRRLEKRIADLETKASRAPRSIAGGDWTAEENPDTNRVELRSPGRRASADEKADLKSTGFRWTPTADAWTRQATAAAWAAAERFVGRWAT